MPWVFNDLHCDKTMEPEHFDVCSDPKTAAQLIPAEEYLETWADQIGDNPVYGI